MQTTTNSSLSHNTFSILTLNICLECGSTLDYWIDLLKRLDVDIICIQEIWEGIEIIAKE